MTANAAIGAVNCIAFYCANRSSLQWIAATKPTIEHAHRSNTFVSGSLLFL
jgi:hypothetical protein